MPDYELRLYRGAWCLYWREGGSGRRRSTGAKDRVEAQRIKLEVEAAERAAAAPLMTVRDLWLAYQASLSGRPAATTMGFEAKAVLPFFGSMLPGEVTPERCVAYTAARRAQGRKDGAIRTELNRLAATFSYAVKHGAIPKAPPIVRPRAPLPRERYLTRAEARTLLDACGSAHLRLFTVLAITTGARTQALLDLTWGAIDLERRRIDFRSTERGRPMKGRVVAPLNDLAASALQAHGLGPSDAPVISWRGAKVASVKKAFREACKAAKLDDVSPHILRHTAAVWMAEAGVSMDEIAQMLGHSDSRLTARVYARYSPEYLRGASQALTF